VAKAGATIAHIAHSPTEEPDPEIAPVEIPANPSARATLGSKSGNHTPARSLTFGHLYWGRDRLVVFLRRFNLQKFPLLPFWNGCSIIVTVLTVEYTLYINHINGHDIYTINSAGQLLAFVTGVGGVFIAVGNFYMEKRGDALAEQLRADEGGDREHHIERTDPGGRDGIIEGRRTSYWETAGPMISFSTRRATYNSLWEMDDNEKC